jgi:hypothetical protein
MTVTELMQKLSALPPNLDVYCYSEDEELAKGTFPVADRR